MLVADQMRDWSTVGIERGGRSNAAAFARLDNLRVLTLTAAETAALESLATRSMALSCTVQDGQVWLANGDTTVEITPQRLQ